LPPEKIFADCHTRTLAERMAAESLTRRELGNISNLIIHGLSNAENLARHLNLTEGTVKGHINRFYPKCRSPTGRRRQSPPFRAAFFCGLKRKHRRNFHGCNFSYKTRRYEDC
jgi:DNA-binding CsgD family transcriptional regulator